MRRWLPLLILILTFTPIHGSAMGLTAKDIITLSRAGLGEEVLLALVEMDGGIFTVDTGTLTRLKEAGVSERVIVAMIRSGRMPADPQSPPTAAEAPDPQPQVILIEHQHHPPVVQQVAVPVVVPVYVPVPHRAPGARLRSAHVTSSGSGVAVHSSGFGVPLPAPLEPQPPKTVEPVYWGWGGTLRPDAWKPAADSKPDHRK